MINEKISFDSFSGFHKSYALLKLGTDLEDTFLVFVEVKNMCNQMHISTNPDEFVCKSNLSVVTSTQIRKPISDSLTHHPQPIPLA